MGDTEATLPTLAEIDAYGRKLDKLELAILKQEKAELRKQLQEAIKVQSTAERLEQTMHRLRDSGAYGRI